MCFCSVVFLLGLESCSKNSKKSNIEEAEKPIILGFSQIGAESAWRKRNSESVKEAAQLCGIQLVFEDAQQKQENQLKALHSFIVYNVDAIAFVPIVEDGWDNVLQEAKEAGIPVIIVDRKIKTKKEGLYTCFIGENGYEDGKKAADYIIAHRENGKKYNIVEFTGTKNSSIATERSAGFRTVIGQYPEYKIIDSKNGDFLRSLGKELCDTFDFKDDGIYSGNKKVDIIFSHNDAMSLGILESFENHNLSFDNYPVIVSVDGEQQAIDALKENKLSCVVECNPNMGFELMALVKDIVNDREVPKVTYLSGRSFVNDESLDFIGPRGY